MDSPSRRVRRRRRCATQVESRRPEVVVALLAAAALAWWSTADRMAGMDATPGADLGALGWFMGVWAVMMAAMMLPSLAPTAAVVAARSHALEPSNWLLFVAGYLLVWAGAGLLAYALFSVGHRCSVTTSDGKAMGIGIS
jgi:predicted metal-binding membrane protein